MKKLLLPILCIAAGATLIYLSIIRRPRKYIPVKGFVMIDPQNGLKVQYEKPITLSGHADGKLWVRRI